MNTASLTSWPLLGAVSPSAAVGVDDRLTAASGGDGQEGERGGRLDAGWHDRDRAAQVDVFQEEPVRLGDLDRPRAGVEAQLGDGAVQAAAAKFRDVELQLRDRAGVGAEAD